MTLRNLSNVNDILFERMDDPDFPACNNINLQHSKTHIFGTIFFSEKKTDGLIGISETLITESVLSCIFHIFAGQPVVLIGTDPLNRLIPLPVIPSLLLKDLEINNFPILTFQV